MFQSLLYCTVLYHPALYCTILHFLIPYWFRYCDTVYVFEHGALWSHCRLDSDSCWALTISARCAPSEWQHDLFEEKGPIVFECSCQVVPHKVVAEVSKIGNLWERLVVVNHGWKNESTDGPKGGWSCVFWSGFMFILHMFSRYLGKIIEIVFRVTPSRGICTLILSYPRLSTLIPLLSTLIHSYPTLIHSYHLSHSYPPTLVQLLSTLINSYPTLIQSVIRTTCWFGIFVFLMASQTSWLTKDDHYHWLAVHLQQLAQKEKGNWWFKIQRTHVSKTVFPKETKIKNAKGLRMAHWSSRRALPKIIPARDPKLCGGVGA